MTASSVQPSGPSRAVLEAALAELEGQVIHLDRDGRVLSSWGGSPSPRDILEALGNREVPIERAESEGARFRAALRLCIDERRVVQYELDGDIGNRVRLVPVLEGECVAVVQRPSDHPQAVAQLRKRSAQLARGMEALQALTSMGDADPEAFLEATVVAAARVLGVARVAIWLRSDDRTELRCHLMADGGVPVGGSGMVLEARRVATYLAALASSRVMAADDVRQDPRFEEMREVCSAFGITSMLDVPIRVQGELIGMVCHAHIGPPRTWSPEESNFAASIADVVANVLQGTKRRQLEAQLRQSQKMEAIGVLAGGVAHDFNNLLTAILGYAALVHGQLHRDDPTLEHIDEIRKAAERAAALTRQLLAFGRKQVMRPRLVQLGAIVAGIEPMLRRVIGEDITFRSSIASTATIHADSGQLEQVLLNLVVNAREAMPGGGVLTVAVLDGTMTPSAGHGDAVAAVVLEVADTGTGMDRQTLSRIFEPFFTTKAIGKGTGLGLAMVYGIVQQSDGRIDVESEPGRGTTFRVSFPAAAGQAGPEPSPAVAPPSASRLGPVSLLLVEDDALVRGLTAEMLERSGCRVRSAACGQEALTMVQNDPEPIDLVLTDIVLPDLNGRELAQRLTSLRPGTKILFMSGYSANDGPSPLDGGEPIALIEKPFGPEDLVAKIQSLLGAKAQPVSE